MTLMHRTRKRDAIVKYRKRENMGPNRKPVWPENDIHQLKSAGDLDRGYVRDKRFIYTGLE